MKHCKKSYICPYGNAFKKEFCAYDKNLTDNDPCPYLLENWEDIIDELISKKEGGN